MGRLARAVDWAVDLIDRAMLVRRSVLAVTVWMTWRAFAWAAEYAATAQSGIEAAAIIAAVTAPITYLQAQVLHEYNEGRRRG